jgi:hypothetical protein
MACWAASEHGSALVESANYPSLRAFSKGGYHHCGTMHTVRVGNKSFIYYSRIGRNGCIRVVPPMVNAATTVACDEPKSVADTRTAAGPRTALTGLLASGMRIFCGERRPSITSAPKVNDSRAKPSIAGVPPAVALPQSGGDKTWRG